MFSTNPMLSPTAKILQTGLCGHDMFYDPSTQHLRQEMIITVPSTPILSSSLWSTLPTELILRILTYRAFTDYSLTFTGACITITTLNPTIHELLRPNDSWAQELQSHLSPLLSNITLTITTHSIASEEILLPDDHDAPFWIYHFPIIQDARILKVIGDSAQKLLKTWEYPWMYFPNLRRFHLESGLETELPVTEVLMPVTVDDEGEVSVDPDRDFGSWWPKGWKAFDIELDFKCWRTAADCHCGMRYERWYKDYSIRWSTENQEWVDEKWKGISDYQIPPPESDEQDCLWCSGVATKREWKVSHEEDVQGRLESEQHGEYEERMEKSEDEKCS